jgi:hypothetical protein
MRYTLLETTNILGKFPTGGSATIALYDINTNASVTLTSASCIEIGATGVFKWNTDRITTYPTSLKEYLWTMTDGSAVSYGKIVLGGYPDNLDTNITSRSSASLVESITITSASTIWSYPTREITAGATSASTIWDYTIRTITSASGLGLASGSSVDNIVGISASTIWDYNTRTLTTETIISASTIAYAVWEELLTGHSASGTAGSALILSKDILNTPIDGIYTLEDVIKIMVSVLAGRLTGGGTDTLTFRDLSNTLNRVIVTVNQVAERTGVTIQV